MSSSSNFTPLSVPDEVYWAVTSQTVLSPAVISAQIDLLGILS